MRVKDNRSSSHTPPPSFKLFASQLPSQHPFQFERNFSHTSRIPSNLKARQGSRKILAMHQPPVPPPESQQSIQRASNTPYISKANALSTLQLSRGIGFQPTILFPILNPQPSTPNAHVKPQFSENAATSLKPRPSTRTVIIEFLLLCLSITTLALSSAYGVELQSLISTTKTQQQRKEGKRNYFVTGRYGSPPPCSSILVFYVGLVPILSILISLFSLVLTLKARNTRRFSIGVSVVFVLVWVGQVGWWGGCEMSDSGSSGM